jgi:hypothetical protein
MARRANEEAPLPELQAYPAGIWLNIYYSRILADSLAGIFIVTWFCEMNCRLNPSSIFEEKV